ncbi:quaternary amine ABC transporter ATP-binding protein [Companilactobacillus sp.]|jgi:glycine betaine/proline transport system ATP-binding protein|uniref:quaternary amine ABC transporter ATP-binding protein n=1 Tax=Companilactobacillus sp. TaxID=2767905 RepID=UPI0025BD3AC6|nr:glycine betaine/L-proline ABC transporter ATP-binding protein [Companilactobacillus sp.]MCH4010021.1 glycine betaine/L-proline ABC transporter ATP-binding protein [Companilactobacillus sp.]MCH4052303.1 glycine betaine/L-proline ABC transporter ATP-binding protein [Companilactobacillus sp.]MCH4077963.1 glycine betaine/L-proline ABC transporter ATP-binding protein [Companilactobacillus sp.]MCH4126539.1 glycine betaine/L-proline ABC transporter ATP-binding protein [Companilactobacillus sp.]MCH
MTVKVEVKNLTKIFGRHVNKAKELLRKGESKPQILKETGATVGVDRANFEVNDGEIFVIMGLSGSGKSTLIRMINRLIEPTDGSVSIDGENLMEIDKKELREVRRKKMSMVFQNFGLLPNRTVLENTEYGLEIQGVDKEERRKKAKVALGQVGIDGYDDEYPSQLSGGMQQRVGLARALANDPQILLMDEAFSALDPLNRNDMQDQLLDLQENLHKTIIFISHDLNEALKIGDRIMIMRDGEIVQTGTPEDILTHPANEYVENFIENVDRSKVLTASNVMIRPVTINVDKAGPRLAIKRMRNNEVSTAYVVDNSRKLVGIVDANDVIKLIRKNSSDLRSVVKTDVPTTHEDKPISDLMDSISHTGIPIAVTNDQQQLLGIIVRGAVLGALAGNEVNEDE